MAAEGNKEAAELLYEVLKTETEREVLQKVFETPIQSDDDERWRFFDSSDDLYIGDLLKNGRLSDLRDHTIERAKEIIINLYDRTYIVGCATSFLGSVLKEQMYNLVDTHLKRGVAPVS